MPPNHKLGQYFTTNKTLQDKVYEFILNSPDRILEPSIGRGDLVAATKTKRADIVFDMYEIDTTIELLPSVQAADVIYADFMKCEIAREYKTIIGNPPYIRTTKGNLYIDFIKKCFAHLEPGGELIFIVPSDFLKLTCATSLLNMLMYEGTFTHIHHPHDEKLFPGASIDVIIFRYCKDKNIEKRVLYNGENMYLINSKGMITLSNDALDINNTHTISDFFDIYVGIVSGRDSVYKNDELGNITILNGENKIEKYIYVEKFPSNNEQINTHLLKHKTELKNRGIRKFNDENWFEWGSPAKY